MAVHLPVFALQFPGLAAILYNELFTIAKFEIFDIGDYVEEIFMLQELEEPFNVRYEQMGIEARNFLMASGLLLPLFLSIFIVIPASIIMGVCSSKWAKCK